MIKFSEFSDIYLLLFIKLTDVNLNILDCSIKTCKNLCDGHGNCVNGECKCAFGYFGEYC